MRDRTVYEISRAIKAQLGGYAVEVLYGEERFARGLVTRNVIQMRETGSETIRVAGVSYNETESDAGQIVAWRDRAVEVVIEAKDTRGGALEHDHKDACNDLVAAFWVALLATCAERRQPIENAQATGQFDGATQLLEAGARYTLSFRITTSIRAGAVDALAVEEIDGSTLQPRAVTRVWADGQSEVVSQEVP